MRGAYLWVMLLLTISPVLLFLFHALLISISSRAHIKISRQKLVFYCVLLMNIPMLFLTGLAMKFITDISVYIYVAIVFNCIGYCYFHFFNMSETARRINILIGIQTGRITREDDIMSYYSYDVSIRNRLDRLVDLGEVAEMEESVYILHRQTLYLVSMLIITFRRVLSFERREGKNE